MWRRVGWTLLYALLGYLLAVIVAFVAVSVAYESRVNRVNVRPDRDRWAFTIALAGLVAGAAVGWWRTRRTRSDGDR